eukprot:c2163_g1_i1.p1 GENE.c2163_g1_i1~~c2163_g1_i1.p1  ORF type:complete len:1333 (+),score=289.23 c2163_g1_i1:145-4143(+)
MIFEDSLTQKPARAPGIKVVVKCRPPMGKETLHRDRVTLDEAEGLVIVTETPEDRGSPKESVYRFDGVFGEDTSTVHLCDAFADVPTQHALTQNMNMTVLLFGSHGSGKSHIFSGSQTDVGLVECTVKSLFRAVQELASQPSLKIVISVSLFEVASEHLRDLLRPNNSALFLDKDGSTGQGFVLTGASRFRVQSWTMVRSILDAGLKIRTPSGHAFIDLIIERFVDNGLAATTHILLGDLAANERGRSQGQQAEAGDEGSVALTACIAAMSDPKGKREPPFGASVLTLLLQPSLMSPSHNLLLITTISPAFEQINATLRTLKYAARAKYMRRAAPANSTAPSTGEHKKVKDMLVDLKTELRVMTQADVPIDSHSFMFTEEKNGSATDLASHYQASIVQNFEERTELSRKLKELGEVLRGHEILFKQKQLEHSKLKAALRLVSSSKSAVDLGIEDPAAEEAKLSILTVQVKTIEDEAVEIQSMLEKVEAKLKRKEDEALEIRGSVPAGLNIMVGNKKSPLYSKFLEVEVIEMNRQLTFRDRVIDEYSRQAREQGVEIDDAKVSRGISKSFVLSDMGPSATVLETDRSSRGDETARNRAYQFTVESAVKALDDLKARRLSRQSTGSIRLPADLQAAALATAGELPVPPPETPGKPSVITRPTKFSDSGAVRSPPPSHAVLASVPPPPQEISTTNIKVIAAAILSDKQHRNPTLSPQTANSTLRSNNQNENDTARNLPPIKISPSANGFIDLIDNLIDLEAPVDALRVAELGGKAYLVGVRRTRPVSWNAPAHAVVRRAQLIEDAYELGRELGSGGFSTVRRGRSRVTGEEYALKIIKNEVFKKNQRHIESEVNVIAGFDHPRLVKLKEVIRTPDHFVLVTELVEGGELFNRIVKMKKFSEETARDIMHQLLEAVEVLHLNGVLHRDLKPENILIDSPDPANSDRISIKLTDFGLAVHYDVNTPICLLAGTPEYAAPEVLSRRPYGYACDMWSLGVILYIMLCGFPPFYGRSPQEVIEKVKAGSYTFPAKHWASISPAARDLVRKLLEINAELRFTIDQTRDHKWMKSGAQENEGSLSEASDLLRQYNATRRQQQEQQLQQQAQQQQLQQKAAQEATDAEDAEKKSSRRSFTAVIKPFTRGGSLRKAVPPAPASPHIASNAATPRSASRSVGANFAPSVLRELTGGKPNPPAQAVQTTPRTPTRPNIIPRQAISTPRRKTPPQQQQAVPQSPRRSSQQVTPRSRQSAPLVSVTPRSRGLNQVESPIVAPQSRERRAASSFVPLLSDSIFTSDQVRPMKTTLDTPGTPASRRSTGSPVRALYDKLRGTRPPSQKVA